MSKEQDLDRFIVVTGGAGFIGSCLIRHLNSLGYSNIVVVDELDKTEKWKNLVGKKFVEILDKSHLFDWLVGREPYVQAIIHLGACSDTTELDASYLLENNYRFSLKLAEYALNSEIRYIYASSAATYGDGKHGFSDDHELLPSLEPLNMYGYSKHLFDLWALSQGVLNQIIGLKFFNVFGPNESHKQKMASAITRMVPQIQQKGKVFLFKSNDPNYHDGEQKRDFIYVKDVVRMTADFLTHEGHGIFNIGSGVASTWLELSDAVFKSLGVKPQVEFIEKPPELVGKYQYYSCADMTKARGVLGDSSICRPLEESVLQYVQDFILPGRRW